MKNNTLCCFSLKSKSLKYNNTPYSGSNRTKLFLETSQNSQKSTCAKASFLIKFQATGLQLY